MQKDPGINNNSEVANTGWENMAEIPFNGQGETDFSPNDTYTELVSNSGKVFPTETPVSLEHFSDIYTAQELRADATYVERTKRNFWNEEGGKKLSKTFESIFLRGVRTGGWLGDWSAERGKGVQNFKVDARQTTEYDDFRHRIDAFSTVYFTEPIEDEDAGVVSDRAILGFDVSINADPETIRDKFMRSYNDEKELPFGFSSLKYYYDDESHGKANLVPHYVIGLSDYDVFDIVDNNSNTGRRGSLQQYNLNTRTGLQNRFKVLSEVRAQNQLMMAMLPDDLDTPIAKQAEAMIYAIDEVLENARRICVEQMITSRALPEELRQRLLGDDKNRACAVVQEYLLETSARRYEEEYEQKLSRHNWKLRNDPEYFGKAPEKTTDTFCQIMAICGELQEKAYDGELDEFRAVMPHNKKVA